MIALLRQPPGGDAEVEIDENFANVAKENRLGHESEIEANAAAASHRLCHKSPQKSATPAQIRLKDTNEPAVTGS
jgi:hypothetical protein